jgi:predicted RNase H-like HicB family nuclease
MQYQIFVQNNTAQNFVASVVGIPIAAEGKTEDEAITNIQIALKNQLETGKLVTINLPTQSSVSITEREISSVETSSRMYHAGIFANDPTFDDWMEKLAIIRQEANAIDE